VSHPHAGLLEKFSQDSHLGIPAFDRLGANADFRQHNERHHQQSGPLKGIDAIRPLFQALIWEFGKPGASFDLQHRTTDGEHGYIVWSAETADNPELAAFRRAADSVSRFFRLGGVPADVVRAQAELLPDYLTGRAR
jgi:hypothetical protein